MYKFLKDLENKELNDYAPIPFWSWNSKLNKTEIIKQIHHMKNVGCGGFVIHARTGLKTEYLSNEWFEFVKISILEAEKLNMNVWLYDENGWPSGFVGGKLLDNKEYLAPYLEKVNKDFFDDDAYAVFGNTLKGKKLLKKCDKVIDGIYENIYVRYSPANTDILNPKVVSEFIKYTHEEYYNRFSKFFGNVIKGFFTDEPQYYRYSTPFTYGLENYFRENYGENLKEGIIHLYYDIEEDYEFRVKYYKALNNLYCQNYYKRLYDWCNEHNCMLTGHSVEETCFFTQMWGCAGCTTSYEYQHIPGIDNLTIYSPAKLSARQVGSLAGQLGKKFVLTETFGCSGYNASLKTLKTVAEKQYVHGVNLMCHHLYPYSIAGEGKIDHPPVFSKHILADRQLREFNEYFTRLGYLLANSKTMVNCAVINPMTSVYLNYDRKNENKSLETDKNFDLLQRQLNERAILYDLIDETILEKHGCVDNGLIVVKNRKYNYIIVPNVQNLSKSTHEILKSYVEQGGNIYFVNKPLYIDGVKVSNNIYSSNITLENIAENGFFKFISNANVEYTYRAINGKYFAYLVNVEATSARVIIPEGYSKINLLDFSMNKCEGEVVLNAGESLFLIEEQNGIKTDYGPKHDIISSFKFIESSYNNLTIDKIKISFDGVNYGKERFIYETFDDLLRKKFCGKIYIKYVFEITEKIDNIFLRREKENYLVSKLNGDNICFKNSDFDVNFEESDIKDLIKIGTNEYIVELNFYQRPYVFWALFDKDATESVRNCLWYDTQIENIYIYGDFDVDKNRKIKVSNKRNTIKNLHNIGYPNFAGKITYEAKVLGENDKAKIFLSGEYYAAEIYVNGEFQANISLFDSADIILIKNKINKIRIILISSLRNMFGPYHYKGEEEKVGISPHTFTLYGSWENGESPYYEKEYKLKPFGCDNVFISFAK